MVAFTGAAKSTSKTSATGLKKDGGGEENRDNDLSKVDKSHNKVDFNTKRKAGVLELVFRFFIDPDNEFFGEIKDKGGEDKGRDLAKMKRRKGEVGESEGGGGEGANRVVGNDEGDQVKNDNGGDPTEDTDGDEINGQEKNV